MCAKKQGLATGSRGWLVAVSRQNDVHVPSVPEAEASSCCTTGQKSQAGQAVCSRLELATQPSCEVKSPEHLVWENLTFHISSHPTIYIPLEQLHQSLQKIPSILHKKLTFSILHYHFYKTPTSVYLLYTLFY